MPPARQRRHDVRGRQAMDVEDPASGGRPGDQRPACAARPAGPAPDGHRGRAPRVLHPGIPGQGGRGAGQVHQPLVHADEDRHLPPVLRGILRHEALRHDRPGRRHAAGRVRGVAGGRPVHRHDGQPRRKAVHRPGLRHLPPVRCHPALPDASRRSGQPGPARRRPEGDSGRQLPARVDRQSDRQGRSRLRAGDAVLSGPGQRRRADGPPGLHQVAHPGAGERRSRGERGRPG